MLKKNNKLNKPNIIIIGASGHAKVVIDIIEKQNQYHIIGLLDSFKPKGYKVFDYEVLGTEALIPELIKNNEIQAGIIAIGDNGSRKQMFDIITSICPKFQYATAIHPQAIIGKDVFIGQGTVIVASAVINASTTIKTHCIINTNASIGHDCLLSDFISVAPSATLGGGVTIKKGTIIGMGAIILGKCNIGAHALIGAAALVNKHIPKYAVAYGIPSKIIRLRQENEPYL